MREPCSFLTIGIDATELFAIVVKHSHQPMAVLATLVFAELCSLSLFHVCATPGSRNYGNLRGAAQVPTSEVT
jgi:hypothetical protein